MLAQTQFLAGGVVIFRVEDLGDELGQLPLLHGPYILALVELLHIQ